jgi:hypothetical protein
MGRIYAESQLVIIAAAGNSSNHGLPGVGHQHRNPQKRIQVANGFEFIEQPNARWDLDISTWASRGWTHQEGYLAPRRLVFTENEVFYVCNQSSWQESVQRPSLDCKSFFLGHGDARFLRLHEKGTYFSATDNVMDFLSSYSNRKLSFESDVLNACTGILDKIVDCHYWGIPVQFSDDASQSVLSLRWRSSYPGKRREGFPSWSWVATTGPKQIQSAESMEVPYVAHTRAVDGSWISHQKDGESRCDVLPVGYGPTLRLIGKFYTASLITSRQHSAPFVVFQHGDDDDAGIALQLFLDAQLLDSDLSNEVKLVAVETSWMYSGTNLWGCAQPPSFVAFQALGDHYERIGITGGSSATLEKNAGLITWKDHEFLEWVPVHPACKGDEEIMYIE